MSCIRVVKLTRKIVIVFSDKDINDKDDDGSSESDSEEPTVKRQKKMLTCDLLVNSLDNSLDTTS